MKRIKLTEKEYNQQINSAFLEGYELGKKDGKIESIEQEVSMNMLRKHLGLPIIQNNQKQSI